MVVSIEDESSEHRHLRHMMAPTRVTCGYPDCSYVSENDSEQVAILQFQSHMSGHEPKGQPISTKQKLPPIERPILKQDVNEEEWETFMQEWRRFKRCASIPKGQEADQLFDCCEKGLGRLLLKEDSDIIDAGEEALIGAMKKMAVIKVAISIRRTKLLSLKQSPGQSFREFYANVKAQAATCNFSAKCGQACCSNADPPVPDVDYTLHVVKDILISGISDIEIRRDVLEWADLDSKSAKDLVGFVEGKETSKSAWSQGSSEGAGLSNYKRNNRQEETETKTKLSLKTKCNRCGVQIAQFARNKNGRMNRIPYTKCIKCHKESIQEDQSNKKVVAATTDAPDHGFIGALTSEQMNDKPKASSPLGLCVNSGKQVNQIVLDHHIFTKEGWTRAMSLSHPTLRLRMFTLDEDYNSLNMSPVKATPSYVDVVTDSGAQSCLWSRRGFLDSGFVMDDLIRVHHKMEAANAAPILIDGAILLRLSGTSAKGVDIQAAVMVYISPDARSFYLSREAMVQLGVIPRCFPQVGASLPDNSECVASNLDTPSLSECDCKARLPPPSKPDRLPFEAIPDNIDKMKEWLLERYSASTFNKCPHRPLPAIEGPPMKFHVDQDAKPVSIRRPIPVPLHWQETIEQELHRDIKLGILERAPHGEPTEWCFPMVVTRKHDGTPRRTIDLSPLNKYCKREIHTSKSPFQMARSVPPSSCKTVLDCWNGFHFVELREEDRQYTNFATSLGILRYKRAPQGYLSSGDGFSRRVEDIMAHILRMERCVDDCLLHDTSTDMEGHWWRIIDILELAGKSGIVMNPEKFQFCQNTVDFAGFRISDDDVEPLPKYTDAILQFPKPKTTTDIRSWFGLVNQVAHYAQLRNMLEPFRRFLSPKVPFEWDSELDASFTNSKEAIVDAIKEGVRIFDISRRTCLRTDWSKSGIGYFLSQKHCSCESQSFGCCSDGWKITLAGSRFLSQTESNYAPIEGEALAVAWALEQTKFFTMGCNNLLVIVDHKPLVKIFSDRRLDEISNPRLFRMKRRTLMWRFQIEYQPGKRNSFSDAVSRNPSRYAEIASAALMHEGDIEEESMIASISDEVDKFFAVTWERVKSESRNDQEMALLTRMINDGFPSSKKEMPPQISNFWDFRHNLTSIDDVVMYMDRIVIPPKLRGRIIENLHSAHQGTSGMFSRAQSVVFWPGITVDIDEARFSCRTCHRNSPSQVKTPPKEPRIPKVPFEMIYTDYFELKGNNFLIVGDRLSGWTEIFRCKKSSDTAGSKGLVQALRQIFTTFGVPRDLSSDGGPEFVAGGTEDFLARWGVKHTLSSAYFPQSNGRAEVAVRITKRLLEDHIEPDGSINNDNFVRALLQLRNTPDRDCKLSPAEVLFGHQLRDAMPQLDKSVPIFDSPQLHKSWRENWLSKERAIRTRMVKMCEKLEQNSKDLPPLRCGDTVFIQNQSLAFGKPNKWDREGTIVEVLENDQYLVRVHGTGRLTLRNRRFLRKFVQRTPAIEADQTPYTAPPPTSKLVADHTVSSDSSVDEPTDDSLAGDTSETSNDEIPCQPDTNADASDEYTSSAGDQQPTPTMKRGRPPGASRKRGFRGIPSWRINQSNDTSNIQPTSNDEHTGSHFETSNPDDSQLRRSSRTPAQRMTYDASTGRSVVPNFKL